MKNIIIKLALAAMLSLSFTGAFAAGGNVNGAILGKVTDSSNAPVAGVTVTVTNPLNGFSRSVTTNAKGEYHFTLPTGKYTVSSSNLGESATVGNIPVGIGVNTSIALALHSGVEETLVLGEVSYTTDSSVAGSGLSMNMEDLALLPVGRSIESVALLAPGTVGGDTAFGDDKTLVSFGGSSVAENVYYINGMNVTNFRNGLGGASVPFEFYSDFQIKTGGYSAEFGRSTGGVINAVTKTGNNEFHAGLVAYTELKSLRSSSPNVFYTSGEKNGEIFDHNSENEKDSTVTDIYVSGPIIKNKLFFYALYEFNDQGQTFTSNEGNNRNYQSRDDDFYGVNLLWNITDNHALNFTSFSDERAVKTEIFDDYDWKTNSNGPTSVSTGTEFHGGEVHILRYDGQITDNFVVSALYGQIDFAVAEDSTAQDTCPNVINSSDALDLPFYASCSGDFIFKETGGDTRKAYRIDAEWQLGDHRLRFGIDNEENTTNLTQAYAANGHYYRYYDSPVGGILPNDAVVPDANGDGSDVTYIRDRPRTLGGSFETLASAIYIEDVWEINDHITTSVGLRSESFNNKNADGGTFVKLDNQIAPRLGIEWDMSGGEQQNVLYANWGRYHLPVANNTNARLAGNEFDTFEYFIFDGGIDPVTAAPTSIDADGRPTTERIGDIQILANGEIPDVRTIVDQTLEPMFQDELILGYKTYINDDWKARVQFTDRKLSAAIDDISVTGLGDFILANPGTDITYFTDLDGDGTVEEVSLTAEELGYPEAKRTYQALEFQVERLWDGKWTMQASYTYSKSKGNSEGLVKSDNGQTDAGLTTDFDFPQLMDGAYGYLPNHREHQFKAWGAYQLTENFRFGAVTTFATGRPINKLGVGHPEGVPYGATYYTYNPESDVFTFNPRGSAGKTSSIFKIDLNAVYTLALGASDIEFRLDVFNLLNSDNATEVFENAESGAAGSVDHRYRLATSYQQPRTVRLGASIRF